MRLPIKPLCEQKRVRSDGTSMIFLQYCYDAEHKSFLSTEIPIPPEFWNRQQLCVKETLPPDYGNFEKINDDIDRQLNLAGDLTNLAKGKGLLK
jgi:Arm DNA-binding domain